MAKKSPKASKVTVKDLKPSKAGAVQGGARKTSGKL
jgi:hypothetical protein